MNPGPAWTPRQRPTPVGWFLQLDNSLLSGDMVRPPELAIVPALALGVSLGAALLHAWGAYRVSALELLQTR